MTWKKIVRQISASADPVDDLIGLIDTIELYLGIGTGESTARDRLATAIAQIRGAGGLADDASNSFETKSGTRQIDKIYSDFPA